MDADGLGAGVVWVKFRLVKKQGQDPSQVGQGTVIHKVRGGPKPWIPEWVALLSAFPADAPGKAPASLCHAPHSSV